MARPLSLAALVGVRLDIGGGLEGVIIGAAAGLGYGLATSGTEEGLTARVELDGCASRP